jgi:hypothetical protein
MRITKRGTELSEELSYQTRVFISDGNERSLSRIATLAAMRKRMAETLSSCLVAREEDMEQMDRINKALENAFWASDLPKLARLVLQGGSYAGITSLVVIDTCGHSLTIHV